MLKQRLIFGLSSAAAIFAALVFAQGWLLFLLLLALALFAQREVYALTTKGGYRVYQTLGLFLGGAWIVLQSVLPGGWEMPALVAAAFAISMRALFDSECRRPFDSVAVTFFGFLYAPVLLSYLMALAQWEVAAEPFGATRASCWLVLFLGLVVKFGDTGAYFMGTRFGKHKMFPRISPKKSWEGLVGGALTSLLLALALMFAARKWQLGPEGIFWSSVGGKTLIGGANILPIAALLFALGVLGDLIESMFKRAVQAKDSSGKIPGLGGILDTLDSVIFAPVCFYFILVWLAK